MKIIKLSRAQRASAKFWKNVERRKKNQRRTTLKYYFKRWYDDVEPDDLFMRIMLAEQEEMRQRFAPLVGMVIPMLENARRKGDDKEASQIILGCANLMGGR